MYSRVHTTTARYLRCVTASSSASRHVSGAGIARKGRARRVLVLGGRQKLSAAARHPAPRLVLRGRTESSKPSRCRGGRLARVALSTSDGRVKEDHVYIALYKWYAHILMQPKAPMSAFDTSPMGMSLNGHLLQWYSSPLRDAMPKAATLQCQFEMPVATYQTSVS